MDYALLFSARKYLAIKSHTPGKLVLKVNPKILTDSSFSALQQPASLPEGVLAVRTKIFPPAVHIDYDPERVPHAILDELFSTTDTARGQALLQELAQHLDIS